MEYLWCLYVCHARRQCFQLRPYAFLALLSPLFAILYGFTGFRIAYEDESLEAHVVSGLADARST
ncbi:hypothetical protein HORIV_63000 [Vreelandella olivaria]|uniref:Uncharacterized protein n=1 Tax=Vreelandella olivaria TaxID=390919 RepID=A0ABM7GQ93_9GAMM|nr:hypothetical protein HORIV_63000 [Halomonas olivaria]